MKKGDQHESTPDRTGHAGISLAGLDYRNVRALRLPGGGVGIALSHRMDSEWWILAHAAATSHCRCAESDATGLRGAASIAAKFRGKSAITSIQRRRYSMVCGLSTMDRVDIGDLIHGRV